MSGHELTVDRRVVDEIVRLAALEIPGVARVSRGGPGWRAFLAGPPIVTHLSEHGVRVRIWVVARPGRTPRNRAAWAGVSGLGRVRSSTGVWGS